jgi:hypothetical protein
MRLRIVLGILGLTVCGAVLAQKPFRQYPGVEYTQFETPPDWADKAEFAFARLMFPGGWNDGYRGRFDRDWRQGMTLWTQDYPRSDRHFSGALRRLTRVSTRSVEQPINIDENEEFDWPRLYAVQVGGGESRPGREKNRGSICCAADFSRPTISMATANVRYSNSR